MIKRPFDILASFFGLIVLSPILLVVALLIWLNDRGPVFFVQRRIGRQGFPFKMYKFRTMRVSNEGAALTIGNDERITAIGRILRKTKLDELPQLWNVLRGDMSLVGPRPEVEKYVAKYSESERRVLALRPGITDPASLAMYDEAQVLASVPDPEDFYVRTLMPEKIRINLDYAGKADMLTDLLVISATVLRPFGLNIDVFRWLKIRPAALGVKA